MTIEELKKLAGIGEVSVTGENLSAAYADKRKKEREENIAPGSDEWFELWFKRKPGLGMPAGFRGRKK